MVEIGSDANSNSSDSNTFYEEDFSSSDDGRSYDLQSDYQRGLTQKLFQSPQMQHDHYVGV